MTSQLGCNWPLARVGGPSSTQNSPAKSALVRRPSLSINDHERAAVQTGSISARDEVSIDWLGPFAPLAEHQINIRVQNGSRPSPNPRSFAGQT